MARPIASALVLLLQISVAHALDRPSARAAAPAKAPAASPAGEAPRVFGDWRLRCLAAGGGQTAHRSCEILQSVLVKDKSATIAEIAFGKPDGAQGLSMTIVVPVDVAFHAAPRVTVSDADPQRDVSPAFLSPSRFSPAGAPTTGWDASPSRARPGRMRRCLSRFAASRRRWMRLRGSIDDLWHNCHSR
ncbi:invasion associated locus B (IalB) protein [Methylosinus sp. sav-2]|uniref:invasion associated locus B family protein n=1 Tax=Methylosinus sp. sav-2 TaxID=2485168 RepID=UPI000479C338|nr:invasion associated locus B family protein [Methylosinus sp. sav-2]TDX67163.1 invasion associated locus B (IalB) protein [Methylosinus sp. sav-2]